VKTGKCFHCEKQHAVVKGKLVEHTHPLGRVQSIVAGLLDPVRTGNVLTQRCVGSGARPDELREKERSKRRAKRQAKVHAVRDESSVLLDAQLLRTKILDAEFPVERHAELLKLALAGYRLEYPNARKIENGLMWWTGKVAKGVRQHKLFCRFCGLLVARFAIGVWARLNEEGRKSAYHAHVIVCALQYLSGVRKIVTPGTMLDGYEGALFCDALTRQCRACGALPGAMCFVMGDEMSSIDPNVSAVRLTEPHEIRLSA